MAVQRLHIPGGSTPEMRRALQAVEANLRQIDGLITGIPDTLTVSGDLSDDLALGTYRYGGLYWYTINSTLAPWWTNGTYYLWCYGRNNGSYTWELTPILGEASGDRWIRTVAAGSGASVKGDYTTVGTTGTATVS